jgi:hypothetical protein
MGKNNSDGNAAEQFPRREHKTESLSNVKFFVEEAEGGFWAYLQQSAGKLPEDPLLKVMNWLLEQLNLGNGEIELDPRGDVVSLMIGRRAAAEHQPSAEQASKHAERRLLAVYLAGRLAQSREGGISPTHAPLSKMFTQQAPDWGHRNTEFHYAFELTNVLARVNKKTFNLEAPPIAGLAPPSVVAYLRESTRCWLYGFHGASVALSRACLEDSLKARLRMRSGLKSLIDAAERSGALDDCMASTARAIKDVGDKFLHGGRITERESRETLDAARSVVEQLFQP